MNCFVRSIPCLLLMLHSGIACFFVFAAEDDFVVNGLSEQLVGKDVLDAQVKPVVVIKNPAVAPIDDAAVNQFKKFIFSQDGNAELGDQRINAEREQTINALDRVVRLTDNQRRKLDLAGQIDRQRFLDRVKVASQNFLTELGRTKEAQKEMMLLRAKTNAELLGCGSFFMKAVPTVLDKNQLAFITERKRSIHGGLIKKALRDFEARLTLSEHQRESLAQIMLDEIPYRPTSENGELLVSRSEQMMMMYRLSCIADQKIESLFDPVEWQKVQPLLQGCYHYKEYLVDRGLLDPNSDVLNADNPSIRFKEPK
jgi:hypothetical protein